MFPYLDRGQGLNHCICDVSNLIDGIQRVRAGEMTFSQAVSAYDAEIVPRGSEEVKCSLENGMMLHDWEKVKESPVFRAGFKPMSGHDKAAVASDGAKAESQVDVSEHAEAQMKREEEEKRTRVEVASH